MAIKTKPTATHSAKSGVMWETATDELIRRCVFELVYGETGTGRTTHALTAPGPIALIHAGEKLEGIVQKQAGDKEIRLFDFSYQFSGTEQQQSQQADQVWKETVAAIEDAWEWARTIVLDTATVLWELLRMARFGKLSQVMPHHYGPLNAEWRNLFKQLRQQNKVNLIAIAMEREVYRNDKPTGRMEASGQKEIPYFADVIVRTFRDKKRNFKATIEKGWYEAAVEGMELEEDLLTFPAVMQMITGQDWSE